MTTMDEVCKATLGNLLLENITLRAQNIELQGKLAELEKRLDALPLKDNGKAEKGDDHVSAKH